MQASGPAAGVRRGRPLRCLRPQSRPRSRQTPLRPGSPGGGRHHRLHQRGAQSPCRQDADILNQPLDVAKARTEAQDGAATEYTGTLQCLRSTVKSEGFKAFYRGIAPKLIKISAVQAITFTAYERYTEAFGSLFFRALAMYRT